MRYKVYLNKCFGYYVFDKWSNSRVSRYYVNKIDVLHKLNSINNRM